MINIKDYIKLEGEEPKMMPTFVRRDPDKRSALDRREALEQAYAGLQHIVNESDIANTSKAWHEAYENLTHAFITCARCEEAIIE